MTRHTAIFWNVARLFGSAGSPIEDVLDMDSDGSGSSEEDVETKLDIAAAVIDQIAAQHGGPPLVVGLAEIENEQLARRLARKVTSTRLRSVDELCRDESGFALDGLNLAMLVDPATTTVARVQSHVIDRTFDTRDVLEVDLETNGQPWSVLANHWPSRLSAEGEGLRIGAAHYVNSLVRDKVRYRLSEMWDTQRRRIVPPTNPNALARARTPVFIMGDFNDEVFNASLDVLHSTAEISEVTDDLDSKGRSYRDRFRSYQGSEHRLLNPYWEFAGKSGSYYRSPRWRTYDQILLTRGCCETWRNQPIRYIEDSATIHQPTPITLPDTRTWSLVNRNGKPIPFDPDKERGCSDHFPVCITTELVSPT